MNQTAENMGRSQAQADKLASLRTTENVLPAALTDDSRRNPAFEHLGMYRINPETGEPLYDITGQPLNAPDQVERTRVALERLVKAVKMGDPAVAKGGAVLPEGHSVHRMNGRLAALYKAVCPVHGDYFCNKIVNGYEVWIPPGCPTCRADAIRQVEALSDDPSELRVPVIYAGATLDTYEIYDDDQLPIASRIKLYAKTFEQQRAEGRGLLMTGPTGTGKTHLALGAAKEVLAMGYKAEFFTVAELINKAWAVPIEERPKWMSKVTHRADLLVLDELGRHSLTVGALNLFFELINNRTNEGQPTVLITNRTKSELTKLFGEEIWSRIVRTMEIMEMNWPNYRLLNPRAESEPQ